MSTPSGAQAHVDRRLNTRQRCSSSQLCRDEKLLVLKRAHTLISILGADEPNAYLAVKLTWMRTRSSRPQSSVPIHFMMRKTPVHERSFSWKSWKLRQMRRSKIIYNFRNCYCLLNSTWCVVVKLNSPANTPNDDDGSRPHRARADGAMIWSVLNTQILWCMKINVNASGASARNNEMITRDEHAMYSNSQQPSRTQHWEYTFPPSGAGERLNRLWCIHRNNASKIYRNYFNKIVLCCI